MQVFEASRNLHFFMPLRIYLDSSDYSVLSDPGKAAREAPGVLEYLLSVRNTGQVEFFFSAAHLTEMAPVQPSYADAALRRGNMLAELCGTNCVVHPKTLFRAEVSTALGLSSSGVDPFDRDGKWFPERISEVSPVTAADHLLSIRSTIADVLPNATRTQKRQLQRKLTKKGRLRSALRSELIQSAAMGDISEILAIYPMRPDAARTLVRYAAGHATAEDATGAFESSLRDIRWMMQWFEKHHDEMTPFVAWARSPASQLTEKIRELSALVESTRGNPLITAEAFASMCGPRKWEEWQDNMLAGVAKSFAENLKPGAMLSTATIDQQCPGISTAIRSLHSAWRSITFENPRKPKDSDFVDALHAMYAPYMDVFRADSFMATHIATQVTRFGTTVVPKLSLLPELLRRRIPTTLLKT